MAGFAKPSCSCLPASSSKAPALPSTSPSASRTLLHFPPFSAHVDPQKTRYSSPLSPAVPIRLNMPVTKKNLWPLMCRAGLGSLDPSQSRTGALSPEMKEALNKFLTENKVVLFMKGNRTFPQCGFSNTVVQILNSMKVPYETVNILEDDGLRQGLKEYSNWPTFPQLYIDGEFFGGCDITLEAFQNGQLKEVLEKAMCS